MSWSMFRRKHHRVRMVLGVRAIGQGPGDVGFDELTHTLDIGLGGVRLGGVEHLPLKKDDVIEIRRRYCRGKFRVMWVGEAGTERAGQVGLQAMDAPKGFWGLEVFFEGELIMPFRVCDSAMNEVEG